MAKSGNGFSSGGSQGDAKDEIALLNTPPHSMEAEQAVLGSVIQSVDAWDKIAEVIIQEDFYNRAHRLIFSAITRLISKSSAADPITLKDELELHNQLEDVGGFTYLVNLARNTPSSSNITAYANIVRERAIVRELIGVANDIADASFNPEGRDSKDLLDLAETKVFEIAEKRTAANEGPVSVSSALRKTIKRIEELSGQDKDVTGVSTGFTDLDKKTSGMQPSDLIIVAARPSMGKCIVSGSLLVDPASGARVSIDDMVANKQGQVTSVDDTFKLVRQSASAFINDGHKPVFKVTTALGKEIETTLTHPFLTGNGWQPLADILVGDKIAVPRVLPIFGQRSMSKTKIEQISTQAARPLDSLEPPLFTRSLHKIKACVAESKNVAMQTLSVALNAPLALAKGNLLGKLSALPVASQNVFFHSEMRTSLTEEKSIHPSLPSVVFELNKPHLSYLLTCLFLDSGYLLESSCERAYYVNVLDGDISDEFICNSQMTLGFAISSIDIARQIQHLLLRFGIIAKLSFEQDRSSNSEQAGFNCKVELIDLANIERFITLINLDKRPLIMEKLSTFFCAFETSSKADLLPSSVKQYLLNLKGHQSWQQIFATSSLACPDNIDRIFADDNASLNRAGMIVFAQLFNNEYLQHLASSDLYWDEVLSIDYQGYRQVYDLTIPNLHNFIAQDICVHNTTFAMNLVENALMLEEKPVLVFSLEMPAEQIMMRMLASLSRVDQTAIRTARLEDTDWAKIQSSVKMLNDKDNLFIDDSSGLTPMDVRTRARKLAREKGGISMIMIDYLQLMRVPSLTENRTLEIAEISRSLKALAKELECPVIALSQLNRGLEQRADKRPINSDLRESGAIEQDADLIMFIYRDEVYNENSEHQGIAEIIIGKQRNGPIGTTRLTFQGRFSRFENYAGPAYGED